MAAIKTASKFFLVLVFSGGENNTFQLKLCPIFKTLKDNKSVIISPNLFDEKKPFLLIEVPYWGINEAASKHFIKKFHQVTNAKYDVAINWITWR